MPLHDESQKLVDAFLSAIDPISSAFVSAAFHYVALKANDRLELVIGRVLLATVKPTWAPLNLETKHIKAGRFVLESTDVRSLINQLLTGKIETPHGVLHFTPEQGGRHGAFFTPFHADGLRTQVRYNVLALMAGAINPIPQPDIDWELKAAAIPYDGLSELTNDLLLGGMNSPTATVEIVAFNIAALDGEKSKVSGDTAQLHLLMAKNLDKEKVTLGYRAYPPGGQAERVLLSGSEMEWSEDESSLRAFKAIAVKPASVVNCVISYDGIAQNHYWIGDHERVPNPRRAAFEAFDPKLAGLTATIENAQVRGQNARQLESAVGWLLWMLGFSVAHLGDNPRTTEAADLLLTTPSGNFAVVECTTGLLKEQSKLALLHARSENVRKKLRESNNVSTRVLSVIVTSRTAAEIKADVEAAERLGILVISREGLEETITRTVFQPTADQMYAEGEQAVAAALAKYARQ